MKLFINDLVIKENTRFTLNLKWNGIVKVWSYILRIDNRKIYVSKSEFKELSKINHNQFLKDIAVNHYENELGNGDYFQNNNGEIWTADGCYMGADIEEAIFEVWGSYREYIKGVM